jgi:hypothetical protein
MAINWDSYRLARAAGYSRLRAFLSAYSEFDANDVEANNAARKQLAEAGFNIGEGPLLPDLVAEWRNLPYDADFNVRNACLDKIRDIHSELAERLAQEWIAYVKARTKVGDSVYGSILKDGIGIKLDVERAKLWHSGDERCQEKVLAQCIDELDRLIRAGADSKIIDAFHIRMRRIYPGLEDQISRRFIDAGCGPKFLADLIAEYRALPLFDFNDDGTDKVAETCLSKIAKIDPEMCRRLSLRRHAEQEEAADGGVLHHKNPVIDKLLFELDSLPLFDDTSLADKARQACLAKIREIDPDLASRLSSQFHADQHKAKKATIQGV